MGPGAVENIGFFCTSPSWGGLELNIVRLARWLGERGHSVTLFVAGGTPLHREAALAGCRIELVGRHRKYFDLPAALKLRARLRRLGVPVVFVFHRDDMDVMAWVKLLAGRSLTLIFQQHMQLGVSRRDPVHAFRYSLYDAWISPLEGLRAEVLAKTFIPSRKIRVIPLGVDPRQHSGSAVGRSGARNFFGIPEGGTLFGILGRIEPGKGQGFLLKAVKRLRDAGHDARLLVVGNVTIEPSGGGTTADRGPDFVAELRSAVRSLGLGGVVWLHPYLADTRPFFQAVDACVMATASETYGMVTLEAMASGTPVIGSDSGGTRELLGGGRYGMLFAPRDEGDFIRRAESLIRGEYSAGMIGEARARVEKEYSHERECAMIEALLEDLRGRRAPPPP